MREELRIAVLAAWLVSSAVILLPLLAPFLLPAAAIERWTPVCQSKAGGGPPCALCGMTTAFLLISRGRFSEATGVNRAAVPLYSAFLLNEVFAIMGLRSILRGGRLWRR